MSGEDRLPRELVLELSEAFAAALVKEFCRRHRLDAVDIARLVVEPEDRLTLPARKR